MNKKFIGALTLFAVSAFLSLSTLHNFDDQKSGNNAGSLALPSTASKPNIVLFLVDDLAYKDLAFIPAFKKILNDQGITFSKFYTTTPLCCPSRSSILRGQYVHNTKIYKNKPGFASFRDNGLEKSTIATWLQDAGYNTALVGKYLNGYDSSSDPTYVPPGWNFWAGLVFRQMYPFGYKFNLNGRVVEYGYEEANYQTDVATDLAMKFVRNQNSSRPFFLFLSYTAPHSPFGAAPRHKRAIESGVLPAGNFRIPLGTNAFDERDVSDKPEWISLRPRLTPSDLETIKARYKDRLESLYALEQNIRRLINLLKKKQFYENTYIFFTSDNGFHLGEHRLVFGKSTTFEVDVRVPLIVVGPGVQKGVELPHLTGTLDLAPTFAEIAGASTPSFIDGKSLEPLFSGYGPSAQNWREAILLEHWGGPSEDDSENNQFNPRGSQPPSVAVRTLRHKYVEYDDGNGEFYDEVADPEELTNKFRDAASQAEIGRLKPILNRLRYCTGANCR